MSPSEPATPRPSEVPFVKGHGTGNDFVVVPDLDGRLDLDATVVAAACDRRMGVGGDGVLRVVRTAAVSEEGAAAQAGLAEWFMDYRNADGSAAEMCGNGIRVFVHYLITERLVSAGVGDVVPVATRAGMVEVTVEDEGWYAARLGPYALPELGGVTVAVDGTGAPGASADIVGQGPLASRPGGPWPATAVSMPNPHAVVRVVDLAEAGDLVRAPSLAPADAYPEGANVEFVVVHGPGHLSMRVHERGVGETASCGTGACAAVVAARRWLARESAEDGRAADRPAALAAVPRAWTVDVPGGRLRVTEQADGHVELAGPAVLVARGVWSPPAR